MYRILIYCGIFNFIKASPEPQLGFYRPTTPRALSPKDEVEVFAPLYPGAYVPKPKPLPPPPAYPPLARPYYPSTPGSIPKPPYTPTTKSPYNPYPKPAYNPSFKPIYPSKAPNNPYPKPPYIPSSPSYIPKQPSTVPNFPSNPKVPVSRFPRPSFFPITPRQSIVPPPIHSMDVEKTTIKPDVFYFKSTTNGIRQSTKYQQNEPKSGTLLPHVFNFTPTPELEKHSIKTTSNWINTTAKNLIAWKYSSSPTWNKPKLNIRNNETEEIEVSASTVTEVAQFLGVLSEYQEYNESDGSFKFGFELENGLSAKVHGYNKNGKQIIEGLYSIFTQDGKPVNIVYHADQDDFTEPEPTNFRVEIPVNFNFENNSSPNNLVSDHNTDQRTINVVGSDDNQFSNLIFYATTEKIDDEILTTTEKQFDLV